MRSEPTRDERTRVKGGFLTIQYAPLSKEARQKTGERRTFLGFLDSGKSLALSESGGAGQSDVPGDVDAQSPDERMIGRLRRSTTVSSPRSPATPGCIEAFATPLEDAIAADEVVA